MEPLVAIVPQSLRVLVERLPAYIDFLTTQGGFSIYQQTTCTLTPAQAKALFARTQDELFVAHTPVHVLLLEREEPYSAFNALRPQLDIVYGSRDRATAMDDIHAFFAVDSDEEDDDAPPPPAPLVSAPPAALVAEQPPHLPPPPKEPFVPLPPPGEPPAAAGGAGEAVCTARSGGACGAQLPRAAAPSERRRHSPAAPSHH